MAIVDHLQKVSDTVWELPVTYKHGMRVPARIIATEKLVREMDEAVYQQISNVATLPGISRYALCMPDGHSGYGFPIGGVAAMDIREGGVISPGGIGFDINCGMRLVITNLTLDDVQPLRVRVASEIEPESVVESNGIDNQGIAFPPANRVPVPGRIGVFGMLPTVEEDLAIAVDVAFEQEEHVHPGLENAPRVRSLARNAGRKALSLGIIFGHALACKLFGPGLERKFLTLLQSIVDVVDEIPIRAPDTGEVHLAFRRTRGGPSPGLLSTVCPCSTVVFLGHGGQARDQGYAGECYRRDDWVCEALAQSGLLSR